MKIFQDMPNNFVPVTWKHTQNKHLKPVPVTFVLIDQDGDVDDDGDIYWTFTSIKQ